MQSRSIAVDGEYGRHPIPVRGGQVTQDQARPDADGANRWSRRHTAAMLVRTAIVGGPIVGSVAAMALISRVLPSPGARAGMVERGGWWAAVLIGSLVAMWLVDRLTRKLAPLAALLDMAVLFPGRAPTRLRVARRAGDLRQLENLTRETQELDQRTGLAEAAEQILALVGSLRAHDRHTRGHSERVRVYTDLIAAEMHLPQAAVDRLRWAALLHDIGKLRVPAVMLNKPAKLSASEWDVIREHPLAGAELASALLPWLGEWGRAIAEHHERFDGSGYPLGLSGRDISVAGRIVAVADSFEVMTAARAYKKALTRSTALEEVVRCSGKQFDPDVVRALLEVSAPRLRWAMGPTSWLVGTPLLGSVPSLTAAGVGVQAAVGVTTVAVAGVTGLTAQAATAAGTGPSATPHANSSGQSQTASTPAVSTSGSHQVLVVVPAKPPKLASPTAGHPSSLPTPDNTPKATTSGNGPPTQPPGQAKKSTSAAVTTRTPSPTPAPLPLPTLVVTPSILPTPSNGSGNPSSSAGSTSSSSASPSATKSNNGSSSGSGKPGVVPTLVSIIHKLLG
ncbi:MAG: hypothetical protein QOG69_299 [Actinomycetota bacterium]|nr:hypothetical protein [Actinomycetota bacterium]